MNLKIIALVIGLQSVTFAEDIFLGLPAAKNSKPDLTKFEGILDTKVLSEPIRPADVAANPQAWNGKLMDFHEADQYLFNFVAYNKAMDDRILMMTTKGQNPSRAKVLTCITEMFRLLGPPAKYLADDPDDDTFKDYLGFVWAGEGVQVLLAFHTGDEFPWKGTLIASGGKVRPEVVINGESKGSKEVPRPADLKAMITTWLQKIKTE